MSFCGDVNEQVWLAEGRAVSGYTTEKQENGEFNYFMHYRFLYFGFTFLLNIIIFTLGLLLGFEAFGVMVFEPTSNCCWQKIQIVYTGMVYIRCSKVAIILIVQYLESGESNKPLAKI